jgi:Na+/phosphate symporter
MLSSVRNRIQRGAGVVRHVCGAAFGAGLLFVSMALLAAAIAPLRHHGPFVAALASTASADPFVTAGTGGAAAVALQSSNAVIAVVMALGRQGTLRLVPALAIVAGANVGERCVVRGEGGGGGAAGCGGGGCVHCAAIMAWHG